MKITNLNITNKFVHFENASLYFDRCGIYLITGKNGSGKTILMEKIVFDTLEVAFDLKEHETLYLNDRSQLFAYVPQDIVESPVNVYEYLTKGNNQVSGVKIDELLTLFHMEDILPTQSFVSLSGGEKNKLAIISALLKTTPYVFMDEPTNSLDDASVELLVKVLKIYSKDRTFVIISHDKRMILNDAFSVHVENNRIEFETIDSMSPKNKLINANNNRTRYLSLMYITSKNKINSQLLAILMICAMAFALFTHFMFYTGFAANDTIPKNGILIYSVDRAYGELNRVYAEGEGLKIDETDYFNLIYYPDIEAIAAMTGVDQIYLPDLEYYNIHFNIPYADENMLEALSIFSMPEVLRSSSQLNFLWVDTTANFLAEGRLPDDDANEVSISAELLKKFYGYDDAGVASAIGESITVDGQPYTIVGIQYTDICIVSYSSGINYGIYEYDEATYDGFASRMTQFLLDQQSRNNVNALFIVNDNGYERMTLNDLMTAYPANNYFSNHYALVWDFSYNETFYSMMNVIASVVGITFGVIFLLLTKNQILLNLLKIKDYENYYIDRKRIKRNYVLMKAIEYLLIIVLSIAGSAIIGIFSGLFFESIGILLIALSLYITPSMIFTFIRMRYVV